VEGKKAVMLKVELVTPAAGAAIPDSLRRPAKSEPGSEHARRQALRRVQCRAGGGSASSSNRSWNYRYLASLPWFHLENGIAGIAAGETIIPGPIHRRTFHFRHWLRHSTRAGRITYCEAAAAAPTRAQLGQTCPGSDTGIRGWVPVGDRNVAKTSVTPPV
jgi:hypothetical protein